MQQVDDLNRSFLIYYINSHGGRNHSNNTPSALSLQVNFGHNWSESYPYKDVTNIPEDSSLDITLSRPLDVSWF